MPRFREVMTRNVHTLSPNDSVASAAQAMDAFDIGVVPVCDGARLAGMVTDRDIDKYLEAQGFARRVAQHLAEALQQKRFDELRIVAAPRFLGHLRKELDPQVGATVTDELNKDFIHYGAGELTRRLFPDAADGDNG